LAQQVQGFRKQEWSPGFRDGFRTRDIDDGHSVALGATVSGADDEIRTRDIDDEHSVALGATVSGADDEIRTRDIDLGKVALYQLSYIRRPV
jgi:hypothetical protein